MLVFLFIAIILIGLLSFLRTAAESEGSEAEGFLCFLEWLCCLVAVVVTICYWVFHTAGT